MSEPSLDDLLVELDNSIARLADGKAPLDQLVAAHQRAVELLAKAQSRLGELKRRAEEAAGLLSQ
ncbi:MAG TPA: exodeoxyribonuclease VII small subunit [Candidatus Dormibacteraeota bacterium]|nr:exodeoxyribonuclease VII small subunit [Candidatus Dormibacteraeota bacterium]